MTIQLKSLVTTLTSTQTCLNPVCPACFTEQCHRVCVQGHWSHGYCSRSGTGADTKQQSETTRVAGSPANIWSFYLRPSRTRAGDNMQTLKEDAVPWKLECDTEKAGGRNIHHIDGLRRVRMELWRAVSMKERERGRSARLREIERGREGVWKRRRRRGMVGRLVENTT